MFYVIGVSVPPPHRGSGNSLRVRKSCCLSNATKDNSTFF